MVCCVAYVKLCQLLPCLATCVAPALLVFFCSCLFRVFLVTARRPRRGGALPGGPNRSFCAHLLVLGRCALLFSCSAAHVFSRSMRAGARSHSWSCAATAAQALPAAPAGMFKLAVHCALCAPWSSVCVRSLAVLFGVCAHLAHGAFVLCRCVGAACVLAGCVAVHLVRSRAFGSLRSLVPRGTAWNPRVLCGRFVSRCAWRCVAPGGARSARGVRCGGAWGGVGWRGAAPAHCLVDQIVRFAPTCWCWTALSCFRVVGLCVPLAVFCWFVWFRSFCSWVWIFAAFRWGHLLVSETASSGARDWLLVVVAHIYVLVFWFGLKGLPRARRYA